MKKLPRYHIINGMFTSPMFAFLRLLFGSIDGAEEHAHTRNKVHAKNRKIGFSRIFCSAIYTYSTVYRYLFEGCYFHTIMGCAEIAKSKYLLKYQG